MRPSRRQEEAGAAVAVRVPAGAPVTVARCVPPLGVNAGPPVTVFDSIGVARTGRPTQDGP